MSIELQPKATILIPAKSGSVNLTKFLGQKPDVVDPVFNKVLKAVGDTYSTENLVYSACTIVKIDNVLDLPRLDLGKTNCLCAVLSVMRENGLLLIPKEEHEIEVVLGLVTFEGVQFVLLVEHEFKRGSDQIHCHARYLKEWKNDNSILLRQK